MLNKDLKLRGFKERKFKQKCVQGTTECNVDLDGPRVRDGEERKKEREKLGGRGYLYLFNGLGKQGNCGGRVSPKREGT
ncbi:hypothetical protein ACN38_g3876 [Penicillium nordicum]|uniref:Uncharacterized protein n=1 Tax=Penicillium nordicum TaxID=229535 RepID=A0A0M8P4F8_9EURO|nr:hypothetical protein ACN38_g3876 [Penicillium nordicum]